MRQELHERAIHIIEVPWFLPVGAESPQDYALDQEGKGAAQAPNPKADTRSREPGGIAAIHVSPQRYFRPLNSQLGASVEWRTVALRPPVRGIRSFSAQTLVADPSLRRTEVPVIRVSEETYERPTPWGSRSVPLGRRGSGTGRHVDDGLLNECDVRAPRPPR